METTRIRSFAAIGILCLGASLFAQEPIRNQCPQEANLGHVTIAYDQFTGEVRVNTYNSQQAPLGTFVLELVTTTEWRFNVGEDRDEDGFHDGCAFDKGFFNVCRPDKVAVIDVNDGFGAWPDAFSFGDIAEPGLSPEFVQSVWLISSSHRPGIPGPPPPWPWYEVCLFVVPEPSTLVLFGSGLMGLIGLRRRS